jgi:hypothetical protein
MEEKQSGNVIQFLAWVLAFVVFTRLFKKQATAPTIAEPSPRAAPLVATAPAVQYFQLPVSATARSQERTIGGTQAQYPIEPNLQFDNVQIFKTNDQGWIGIEMGNGYVEKLFNTGDYYSKTAVQGQYFNLNIIVSGGATYKYVGSIH